MIRRGRLAIAVASLAVAGGGAEGAPPDLASVLERLDQVVVIRCTAEGKRPRLYVVRRGQDGAEPRVLSHPTALVISDAWQTMIRDENEIAVIGDGDQFFLIENGEMATGACGDASDEMRAVLNALAGNVAPGERPERRTIDRLQSSQGN